MGQNSLAEENGVKMTVTELIDIFNKSEKKNMDEIKNLTRIEQSSENIGEHLFCSGCYFNNKDCRRNDFIVCKSQINYMLGKGTHYIFRKIEHDNEEQYSTPDLSQEPLGFMDSPGYYLTIIKTLKKRIQKETIEKEKV